MQAVQIDDYGSRQNLILRDVPVPKPGPGEALVRVEHAGINFIDIYMREGHYRSSVTYGSALPITLGMEGCGVIEQAGPNDQNLSAGDRVSWCLQRGAYAEFALVDCWRLAPVPDEIDSDVATTLMLQGCTAHYLANSAYRLQPGDTCLVHAGAGGVGRLLIQLAVARGARVFATVGSAEKAELVTRLGVERAILYREEAFDDIVLAETGGQGVNVVYDSVGQDTIKGSLRSLRRRGLCVNYGGSSGLVEQIQVLELAEAGSVFFTRPHLAHYIADRTELLGRTNDLFAAVRHSGLDVRVDQTFDLSQVAQAHAKLENRMTTGKLLLNVS